MRLSKILKLARLVRLEAERLARDLNGDTDNCLAGYCGDTSKILLELLGKDATFESGCFSNDGHAWLRLKNGMVLDLTASQFGPYPKVYLCKGRKYQVQQRGRTAVLDLYQWGDKYWRAALRKAVKQRLTPNSH
jgi:hypothetical protein